MDLLNGENRGLTDELQRLSEECGKLVSENNSIKVHSRFPPCVLPGSCNVFVLHIYNNIEL